MQFEATGTNGVQLNERLTGHNDATCNTAAGMRPAATQPVGIHTMVVARGVFSRRCGLAVADQSCESQGGWTTFGALRARAAVVPPSSSGKMVSN